MNQILFGVMVFLFFFKQSIVAAEERHFLQGTNGVKLHCNPKDIQIKDLKGPNTVIITLLSSGDGPWFAEIHISDNKEDRTLILDPKNPNLVFLDWKTFAFEVPKDGKVFLNCPEGNPTFRFIGYLGKSNEQEAKFDQNWPKPIEKADSDYQMMSSGLGWLLQVDSKGRSWGNCNVVHIAEGYWVTNLHCFQSKSKYDELFNNDDSFVLLNIISSNQLQATSVKARPVAGGRINISSGDCRYYKSWCNDGTTSSSNEIRDYVILKETNCCSNGVYFPLKSDMPMSGTPLLSRQWQNTGSGQKKEYSVELMYDNGDKCTVVNPGEKNAGILNCPKPLLAHQCGSKESSSGSPLLNRENKQVVALHFFSPNGKSDGLAAPDSKNCALPASLILQDLRAQQKNELADKLTAF